MNRETLAAQIYAYQYCIPKHRDNEFAWYVSPRQAFKAADHFLKEAKRQAAKDAAPCGVTGVWTRPEPPKCPCHNITVTGISGTTSCMKCGRNLAEPPKPKREPREWVIEYPTGYEGSARILEYVKGQPIMPSERGKAIRVREVLPTEAGGEA